MGRPGRAGGAARRPRRERVVDLGVLALYVALAVVVLGGIWAAPDERVPPGHEPDPNLFKWFLAWGARAVTHLDNPLFTTMQGAPDGVNVMGNTSVLGLGVPFAPVTVVFGAGVSFVALLTLGLAGTAAGWYVVLRRHLGVGRAAAAVGGGLCGFAPALVAHALGHLHLTAQFVVPFIVSFALRLHERERGVRNATVLGGLIAYQAFVSEEVLLLTALALGVFVAAYAVSDRSLCRERWRPFLARLAFAGAVAGVLLAYPLWVQFAGPQSYLGLGPGVDGFGADAASYTAAATQTLFGDRAGNAGLAQNHAEENAFFGWPLTVLTLVMAGWMWRRRTVRAAAAVGIVFAVLSLGAAPRFRGTPLPTEGPWAVLGGVPLLDSVIPTRLAMVVIPAVAVIVTLGVDRLLRARPGPGRLAALVAVGAVLVTVVPTPLPAGRQAPVPRFVTAGAWRPYLEDGGTLVTVPMSSPDFSSTLRWAAAANIGYAIPAGYFLAPVAGRRGGTGTFWPTELPTQRLLDDVARTGVVPAVTEADRSAARRDLAHWQAAVVVLDPSAPHASSSRTVVEALLGPGEVVADVLVWDVGPPADTAAPGSGR